MYTYAISIPDRIVLDPAWQAVAPKAKIKRYEFSCSPACVDTGDLAKEVDILARMQQAGDIAVPSIHIPFGGGWEFASATEEKRQEAVAKTIAFLEACQPLNCRNFTMHGCLEPMPLEPEPRAVCLDACRRTLAELAPVAKRLNLSINVEDLPRSCLGNTAEELASMIEQAPADAIGVCFDVNHFCGCPEKLADGIDLLAARIRSFHLSDYDGVDECHWYPGLGVIDWKAIMAAVRRLPNDVVLIFESWGFVKQSSWQKRSIDPAILLRSYEPNVFFLENVDEITKRLADQMIP